MGRKNGRAVGGRVGKMTKIQRDETTAECIQIYSTIPPV